MRGKRHTPQQVIVLLRQAEADLGSGLTIAQVCQRLAVSEQTFHRWRNQYALGYRTPAEFAKSCPRADSAAPRRPEDTTGPIVPTLTAPGT